MTISHFVSPLSVDRHVGYFHLWNIMNNATMKMQVQVFMWTHNFISFRYTLRRIAGSNGDCVGPLNCLMYFD